MLRPESVCLLQIDGITIERRAQATALVGAREMELNHCGHATDQSGHFWKLVARAASMFADLCPAIST